MAKNYYSVLGVSDAAGGDEIRSAYRRQVKVYHPDHYGTDCEPFMDIQEAYSVLAPSASALLRPGGRIVLELGDSQAAAVREIVSHAGFEAIEVRPDLRGIDRVLVAARPPSEGEA